MFANLPDDGRKADWALEVTDEERDALVQVVKQADGRKSEVQTAREALGVYDA